MKKTMFALAILSLLLFTGCNSSTDDGDTQTITSDNGDQDVEVTTKNEDSWCAVGSEWKSSSAQADVKMMIEGIETSGKYAGYCHVTYDVDSQDAQANMDLYFDQEGNGYQVIVVNGQQYESTFSSGQ